MPMFAIAAGVGWLLGWLLLWWIEWRLPIERRMLGWPDVSLPARRWRQRVVPWASALLIGGLVVAEIQAKCLSTPEVQPSAWGEWYRVAFHALLLSLLLAATVIDLDCYLIPDVITCWGMVAGVACAAISGELQIAHLWVDWSVAIPQLQGPHIPDWYDRARTGHALAWSLTGLLVGGVGTYLVRLVSSLVLGVEAMGLGDVTLMAMIGSFLGWQAVLLVFAVAPLTGLLVALVGQIVANRPYLPYGPCLSLATVLVLVGWSSLWEQTRLFFSDLVAVALVVAVAVGLLVGLLALVRLYRAIPTRSASMPENH
jgi:leader peptidase (prepilin peptidase) / N-methyltransferase